MDKKVVGLIILGIVLLCGGVVALWYASTNTSTYSIELTLGLFAIAAFGIVGGLFSAVKGMKLDNE